jgi:hypothetical protein
MFTMVRVQEISNFLEYLKFGWSLNLSVGIDFSSSNGLPRSDPKSLHYT